MLVDTFKGVIIYNLCKSQFIQKLFDSKVFFNPFTQLPECIFKTPFILPFRDQNLSIEIYISFVGKRRETLLKHLQQEVVNRNTFALIFILKFHLIPKYIL